MSKFFRLAFAVSGSKTAIPDDADPDGYVSYEEGYPEDYSRNPSTDPLAKNIERLGMNEILFDITDAIRQYQINGTPDFITTADNDGVAFSYSKDAKVRYDDGGGFDVYTSLVDSNNALPTDITKWVIESIFSDGNKGAITVSANGATFSINTDAVTAAKIAADAVTTVKILDANVTAAKLASDSVTTVKILNANVTTAKIADANVTNAKLANMATSTIKGRTTSGTGVPEDLTVDQTRALLKLANGTNKVQNTITGFLPVAQTFTSATVASMTIEGGVCSDSTLSAIIGYGNPGDTGQWVWNITNSNAINGYQGGTTLPNSTTIHFFYCQGTSGQGIFASTSLTSPTLPSGYNTYFRRIFSLKTNASGVLPLTNGVQEGAGGSLIYYYNVAVLDISVTNLGTSATQFTLSVPAGIVVKPFYKYNMPTTGRAISLFCGAQEGATGLPAASASGWTAAPGYDTSYDSGTTNYVMPKTDGSLLTDNASKIYALSTGASTSLYFVTRGFEDFRRV